VVFLQGAARESGPAGRCFRLMDDGALTLYLCDQILAEITEVLRRPKLQQRFPTLTADRVDAFLGRLQKKAILINSVPEVFTYPRDPDDEPYINLALASHAHYLVTWDKDMLDMADDDTTDGKSFRQNFPDLRIVDPVTFLREFDERKMVSE
jgi:putative PIN family toxin of toxin-antitoxin system